VGIDAAKRAPCRDQEDVIGLSCTRWSRSQNGDQARREAGSRERQPRRSWTRRRRRQRMRASTRPRVQTRRGHAEALGSSADQYDGLTHAIRAPAL